MPELHSENSASAFAADMRCPGRRVLQAGYPNTSNAAADAGTAMHSVAEAVLKANDGIIPANYVGDAIDVAEGKTVTFTADHADLVQIYVDNIREMTANVEFVSYENRVHYGQWLGVDDAVAFGTADCIALQGDEIQVHDLKTGYKPVIADDNEQLMLYALGAIQKFGDFASQDVRRARLVIHQPKVQRAPSEWVVSIEDLEKFAAKAKAAVAMIAKAKSSFGYAGMKQSEWEALYLRAGPTQCEYCRARPTCPAARDWFRETVAPTGAPVASPEEFEAIELPDPKTATDAEWLAAVLNRADDIEGWLKACRAEGERRLLAGEDVPGWKIVEGKRGNRQWIDAAQAEELFKTFRMKQEDMYDFSLKSFPQMEKRFGPKAKLAEGEKPIIGPRQWIKVEALMHQPPGRKHMAPASDPRPAVSIVPVADEMETIIPAADDDIS